MHFNIFAGSVLDLLACHRVEDIREVLAGLCLQIMRLVISDTFIEVKKLIASLKLFFFLKD